MGFRAFPNAALISGLDSLPQKAELAIDLHEHLIQMPAPLRISVDRCGSIFENCSSVSQNWSRFISASFRKP
jgi:hypothetical protein